MFVQTSFITLGSYRGIVTLSSHVQVLQQILSFTLERLDLKLNKSKGKIKTEKDRFCFLPIVELKKDPVTFSAETDHYPHTAC